ncbi:hypothetical protein [Phycisphaera mikurensis]|uniref:Uncharacterized protein n=1 Tax=Phycisphaera mikurensis (strain NBRC 102666 / KCTC 22515 / FYK2301M01) TaxID=1142394 RepID=I0IB13_PHYMF|nr:hypothetical protein [Phycisphaera mikurensis]MBB6442577.1 alkylation response protein AidB-like acyl-CoA dehydrogenase [Phycisphaera mikurensis]BAM02451.1 hypothetical protein PSMK_02920 [Phycisphaera mikurensis NBRC 102666]
MTDTPLPDDELRGFLREMVEAQQSGKHEPVMGFAPARGRRVWVKAAEGGEETPLCEGITPKQLRALAAAGLMSVTTPRSYWRLRLRPAAFDAVSGTI